MNVSETRVRQGGNAEEAGGGSWGQVGQEARLRLGCEEPTPYAEKGVRQFLALAMGKCLLCPVKNSTAVDDFLG